MWELWELIVYTMGGVCVGFVLGKTAASNLYYSHIIKQSNTIKELEMELDFKSQHIKMQDAVFQHFQRRLQKQFADEPMLFYGQPQPIVQRPRISSSEWLREQRAAYD